MKKHLRLTAMLLIAVMTVSSLAACGGSSSAGASASGESSQTSASGTSTGSSKDTLNVATYSDPKTLNPWQSDARNLKRIACNIFQRLVDRNDAGDGFVGVLAESWKETKKGITFNIRKGVKFQDGQDMTAKDVVYSLKTASTYAGVNFGWDWIDFDNIKATDDYTVYVPYKYYCGLTLSEFASNNMYIMCEDTWKQYGDSTSQHPNGTGPFKVSDWVQGDHCTLVRNDNYWGTAPKLSTINFKFIAENSQALIELETGGVDLVLDVIPLEVANIEASDKMELEYGKNVVEDMIHMNCENKYFKDVRVRQAVAYAVSIQDIFKGNYRSWGQMAYSFITPDVFGYTNEFEGNNYPYGVESNIKKAKELLTEAGYPNGFSVDLVIDDDSNRVSVAEIVRNNLAEAGINATIQSSDYATFQQKIYSGEAAIYLNGVNADSMEPDSALYMRWYSGNIGSGGTNYTRYKNTDFDKCLEDAREIPELKDRSALYKTAQETLMKEVPSIPYYVRQCAWAKTPSLKGVKSYAGEAWVEDCYFQ